MNRLELELQVQQSELPLKSYLQQIGVSYSTYHSWRRKCSVDRNSVKQEPAPISFKRSVMESSAEEQVPHGVTVLFPNGLRAHFGNGSEEILADTSLLAEILLQKYEYHVPFCRQIQQYRHLGMKGLTESTLDGWLKKTVDLLRPLYEELKREVFSCDYVQADETTVPVISREKHKADKEYLWMVRSVMERLVIFHYNEGSRAGAVMDAMKVWMETEGIRYSPNSQTGKAIMYAYTRWDNMMRCLEDGRLLWDNKTIATETIRLIVTVAIVV